ncbi:M23 family metallopeptidase [Pedobacter sp. GR22-6]|uniref:M23 family metallopeptidase n=1 Tax=Pedobacter sp. GR22-6 TaxID=3127957 RepID=UPI00307D55C7
MFIPQLKQAIYVLILLGSFCLFSCKSGTLDPFKPASPHEQYQRKLVSAGLHKTAMGTAWINAATSGLQQPLTVKIPFQEQGYFAAEKVPVAVYRFNATRGQRLSVRLDKKPVEEFTIYMDLWQLSESGSPKLLNAADTLGNPITVDIEETGSYLVRLQPELLRSGAYTLEITTGPSLGYPISGKRRDHIQSFFGDGRDGNTRKHEGIDLFAARGTPVVAIAEGAVVRVNENNLGGKVVWMRPKGKNYTLYYAHLDQQIAVEGQPVKIGDTLGLVGNTGNAKTTVPHLHFGIYTTGGAVDPLPFLNPVVPKAPKIQADLDNLNATLRTSRKTPVYKEMGAGNTPFRSLPAGTIIQVNGASAEWYRSRLPDGQEVYIQSRNVLSTKTALRTIKLSSAQQQLYDQPDSLAAVMTSLIAGTSVKVLGSFEGYQLITAGDSKTGWIKSL